MAAHAALFVERKCLAFALSGDRCAPRRSLARRVSPFASAPLSSTHSHAMAEELLAYELLVALYALTWIALAAANSFIFFCP